MVDPGSENNAELLVYLKDHQLLINTVILTHEHYDHIAGVNNLLKEMPFNLLCSEAASSGIGNSKINFSAYLDEYMNIEIDKTAVIVRDGDTLSFESGTLIFYETPGHSMGSICFNIGKFLFTGDTILNNIKSPLKLPGSNKYLYKTSIEKLEKIIKPGMVLYPGHGECFDFKSWSQINTTRSIKVINSP